MPGRKGFEPHEIILAGIEASDAFHEAADAGRFLAAVAVYRHLFARCKATSNRAKWRMRGAQRGARLGRMWRDFARGFRGLEWRRRKVDPGVWAVELHDASGAWIHAATVEAPPLRRMEDRVLVRVIPAASVVQVTLRAPDLHVDPLAANAPQSPPKADLGVDQEHELHEAAVEFHADGEVFGGRERGIHSPPSAPAARSCQKNAPSAHRADRGALA